MVADKADEADDEAEAYEAEAYPNEYWEPIDETPVLPVVGERETVTGGRVVHPLDEFAERPEEVVDLLRSGRASPFASITSLSPARRASISMPHSRPQATVTVQPSASRCALTAALTLSSVILPPGSAGVSGAGLPRVDGRGVGRAGTDLGQLEPTFRPHSCVPSHAFGSSSPCMQSQTRACAERSRRREVTAPDLPVQPVERGCHLVPAGHGAVVAVWGDVQIDAAMTGLVDEPRRAGEVQPSPARRAQRVGVGESEGLVSGEPVHAELGERDGGRVSRL